MEREERPEVHGGRNVYRGDIAGLRCLEIERRKHQRDFYDAPIEFLKLGEGQTVIGLAVAIDRSKSGIGLSTDFVIYPGQVMIFRENGNRTDLKFAIVLWSTKTNGHYKAGLRFI